MVNKEATAVSRLATRRLSIPGVERKTLLSAGSVLAAMGASACCVVPLVFLSLGVGGAWLGNFNALYPYKPYLIGAALTLLAARYVRLYGKRRACCDDGKVIPTRFSTRFNKAALWVSTALIAAAIALPYLAPVLL